MDEATYFQPTSDGNVFQREDGTFEEGDLEIDTSESPLDEVEEMALAAELLDLTSEDELDQFLGKVFKKVWGGIKKVARPLGRVLKGVAKVALPIAGKVAGGFFGGPLGAMVGGQLGSAASRIFGAEVEGLSGEDQSFEMARRYVRLAAASAARAARMPEEPNLMETARRAVRSAARQHAPGLLRRSGARPRPRPPGGSRPPGGYRPGRPGGGIVPSPAFAVPVPYQTGQTGTWARRGQTVVVFNCNPNHPNANHPNGG